VNQLKTIQKSFKDYTNDFKPFSWQTFVLLSLFSWIMSLLVTNDSLKEFLARMGLFFLTIAVWWATANYKISLFGLDIYPGPWITGALATLLIFQGWTDDPSVPLIVWPWISAFAAIFPKFLKHGSKLINPTEPNPEKLADDRFLVVRIFLFAAILSCWFQFHFLVQDWLRDYPSLTVEPPERSGFLVKIRTDNSPTISRGVLMLNLAENDIASILSGLQWSAIERWLLNIRTEIVNLEANVKQQMPPARENVFWNLQAQVLPGQPGYVLQLRAVWRGPSLSLGGYYAEKSCQITPVVISSGSGTTGVPNSGSPAPNANGQFICQPVKDLIPIGQLPTAPGSL
jgi:hypothetical protein